MSIPKNAGLIVPLQIVLTPSLYADMDAHPTQAVSTEAKTWEQINDVTVTLHRCSYQTAWFDFRVRLGKMGDGLFLQVIFDAPDIVTGELEPQHGRKWYLSPHMAQNEIIQTLFLAIGQAEEHERRENFKFDGAAVLGPHLNLEALAARLPVAPELFQRRTDPASLDGELLRETPPPPGVVAPEIVIDESLPDGAALLDGLCDPPRRIGWRDEEGRMHLDHPESVVQISGLVVNDTEISADIPPVPADMETPQWKRDGYFN